MTSLLLNNWVQDGTLRRIWLCAFRACLKALFLLTQTILPDIDHDSVTVKLHTLDSAWEEWGCCVNDIINILLACT